MNSRDDDDDDDESMIFNVDAYGFYLVNPISLIHLQDGFQVSNLWGQYVLHNFYHDACSIKTGSLTRPF